jgi:flagellar hook-associated protein 2
MTIRLSGLTSGLDTDTIVQALVSAYSYKKDKYVKAQTKLSWTQDSWKSLNTKVYSLYTNISSLRYSSAYTLKKTTVSDSTKASVTASNSAVNGSQKLNILQVAQAGYLTGGKLDKSTTTSTTLAELGYTGGDATINVDKGDGTSQSFTVSATSKVSDVISQLKSAGLNASLDTTNSRIFVSSKSSGADNDFNLIGGDSDGVAALNALGLNTSLYTDTGKVDDGGNKILAATAAGAAYEKYSVYATGTTVPETVKQNIADALTAYQGASKTYTDDVRQVSNLTSALTYAKAYSDEQDFYSTYGISDTDRFNNVMSVASGSRDNTLVDDAGNLYTKTSGTDTNGDTVYGYTDSDGNKTYVSKEVTYTDTFDNTYKKNSSGQYVQLDKNGNVAKDGEGNEIQYGGDTADLKEQVVYHTVTENVTYKSTDADGNETTYQNIDSEDVTTTADDGTETTTKQYYITVNGKKYVSDSESGKFTNTTTGDDGEAVTDTIEIAKVYSYEPGSEITDLKTVTKAYNDYKKTVADKLQADSTDDTYTEENAQTDAASKLSTFASNLSTVKSFEGKVTDTETGDKNRYLDIMNKVHSTYGDAVQAAKDAGSADKAAAAAGADAINSLIDTYKTEIASLKTDETSQQETMDKNEAVASLASLTDDEYTKALDALATKALTAASTLSAAAQAIRSGDTETGTATKMDGQDSIIKLNDVEYTGSSNSITVNGITINALAVTGDGDDNAITITTAVDTQGIYDKIKDFLTEYNSIINEMCKLYNADSSSGYDPLTDDEKDAMSDSEVEKWETKIKDALLRHDSTLNSVMTSMTNAMAKSIKIDGKSYSLSSFGISTLGYLNSAENEYYAYHIDGDEDDSNTSGNTDKLMAAISSDPDTVTSFFQQLTSNLYDAIGSRMKSTTLSSIYTIYNDKQMDTQYSEYTDLIEEWETRISDKEEYYYNKFSTMESSLATLNSTQSSLSSYFG